MNKVLKRFWYLIPVVLSLVALTVALSAVTTAQTETGQISNKLISPLDAAAQDSTVALSWKTDGDVDYHQGVLNLVLRIGGDPVTVNVRAVSNVTQSIDPVELRVRYNSSVISVSGAIPVVGETDVYNVSSFTLPAGGTVEPLPLVISVVGAGTTNLEVWAVDSSLP